VINKQRAEKTAFALLALSALVVIIPVAAIVYFLIANGAKAISWTFLTQPPRSGMTEGGVFPAIIGTLYLLAGTIAFAVPVGIFAAIYLTEYAPKNILTRIARLAIVNLAGVPSIVYGLFGYGLFVLFLHCGVSILAGSLTLALLVLPVIITSAEEALLTVPQSFRDGSLALGATKWQTIQRVVLPNSAAGIITGVILGVGRAAGETAPIMFTAAAFYLPQLPHSAMDKCMALPYHLYVLVSEAFGATEQMKWGTALVLLMLVLGMNLIAAIIRGRFRRSRTW
jgi:phosphate transport system permease protein